MNKKAKSNKVISSVLVMLIILTQMSMIVFAESDDNVFGIIKNSKDITEDGDGYRTWEHVIEVTGQTQQASPEIDVVLVIDRSHSMNETMGENGESRLDYAENAAYTITDSILEANSKSRVAVITFADGFEDSAEGYDTDLISSRSGIDYSDVDISGNNNILENDGDINFNFTSNREDIVYAIETTLSSTEYWTFMTDGFDRAYNMIDSREEDNDNPAYVIFLSDGAPSQALYLEEYGELTNSDGIELSDKDVVSVNAIDPTNSNHKTTDYAPIITGGMSLVKKITLASSERLQDEATVITVSTDVSESLESFFKTLASDNTDMETYYNAGSEDLGDVFKSIITDISANAQVIDNIPEYMSVIANPNSNSDEKFVDYNGNIIFTEATSEGDNEIIEWNIFDINGSETLTYYTKLNDEFDYDTDVDSNGSMNLNGETTLSYTGSAEDLYAPIPVANYSMVTYEVPNADEDSLLIKDDYLYAIGENVIVSTLIPERDGYSFVGWESDQYGMQLGGYEFNITGPTNFVAQWVEKEEYSISIEESASIAGKDMYETEILQISDSNLVDFKIEVRNDGKNDIEVNVEELGLDSIGDNYEISNPEANIIPGSTATWLIKNVEFSDYEENSYKHSSSARALIGDNSIDVSDSVIIVIEKEDFIEAEIIKEVYYEENDTWLTTEITIDEGDELIFRYTVINQGSMPLTDLAMFDEEVGFAYNGFDLLVDTTTEVVDVEFTTTEATKIVNYIKTVETEVDGKIIYTTEAATKLVPYVIELTTDGQITIEKNLVSYRFEEQLFTRAYDEAGIYISNSDLYLEGDEFRVSNTIKVIVNAIEDNYYNGNNGSSNNDDETIIEEEIIIEDETLPEGEVIAEDGALPEGAPETPADIVDIEDGEIPQGPSTGMKANIALYLSAIIALAGSSILYLKKVFSN